MHRGAPSSLPLLHPQPRPKLPDSTSDPDAKVTVHFLTQTPIQQLQSDYFMRWDIDQRCFGNPRGQLEYDFWAVRPLKSLILEDFTMTMLVPEPVLVLISLLSLFSPATYDPIFYFSNLSGSSHHVKQRSDLAWKKAVNCFL